LDCTHHTLPVRLFVFHLQHFYLPVWSCHHFTVHYLVLPFSCTIQLMEYHSFTIHYPHSLPFHSDFGMYLHSTIGYDPFLDSCSFCSATLHHHMELLLCSSPFYCILPTCITALPHHIDTFTGLPGTYLCYLPPRYSVIWNSIFLPLPFLHTDTTISYIPLH